MRARATPALPLAAALLAGCGPAPAPAPRVPPTAPMARVTPPPAYPEELACAGLGGQVVLTLGIGADGKPSTLFVKRGSGHEKLDAAAVAAVRGWEFAPATAAGKPVPAKIEVPVTFTPPQVKPDRCFALEERLRREAQQ